MKLCEELGMKPGGRAPGAKISGLRVGVLPPLLEEITPSRIPEYTPFSYLPFSGFTPNHDFQWLA